ncbi:uncharacterized protein LOC111012732 [Momordica charantia]|uniref:Uncharacterized protein LOC111012732 n=1 Tax=Momordica charantia TaxID=3673 RepID=A0A6J1CMW6_MOMCH|nr:uncharacterized protein LOC111012732 [Momordica charantia]
MDMDEDPKTGKEPKTGDEPRMDEDPKNSEEPADVTESNVEMDHAPTIVGATQEVPSGHPSPVDVIEDLTLGKCASDGEASKGQMVNVPTPQPAGPPRKQTNRTESRPLPLSHGGTPHLTVVKVEPEFIEGPLGQGLRKRKYPWKLRAIYTPTGQLVSKFKRTTLHAPSHRSWTRGSRNRWTTHQPTAIPVQRPSGSNTRVVYRLAHDVNGVEG